MRICICAILILILSAVTFAFVSPSPGYTHEEIEARKAAENQVPEDIVTTPDISTEESGLDESAAPDVSKFMESIDMTLVWYIIGTFILLTIVLWWLWRTFA